MARADAAAFGKVGSLDDIYALLATLDIENGWAKKEPSMWPQPRQGFVPAHWSYVPAKAALDAAGRFVNTELAERRNLILVNPIPGNTYPTVRTLVAAYQMVKAGEVARSHRHTANALRLVLDTSPGAYTVVDGVKIPMEPGDVLLTPNWCWHAHSNESTADAYWMDILDVPTVHLLNPMFFEHHEEGIEPVTGTGADSPFRYAFAEMKERLAETQESAPGVRRIELQAQDGGPAMATIALHVARLEPGARLTLEATTSSTILAVMDGVGRASAASQTFTWARGDALALPAGAAYTATADRESYLLTASDAPLMKALGWLRPVPTA
jgi:gentisate 1,2-dioxygenase